MNQDNVCAVPLQSQPMPLLKGIRTAKVQQVQQRPKDQQNLKLKLGEQPSLFAPFCLNKQSPIIKSNANVLNFPPV